MSLITKAFDYVENGLSSISNGTPISSQLGSSIPYTSHPLSPQSVIAITSTNTTATPVFTSQELTEIREQMERGERQRQRLQNERDTVLYEQRRRMEIANTPIYYSDNNWGHYVLPHLYPLDKSKTTRKLRTFESPNFDRIKDILPKDLLGSAVKLEKKDITSRICEYLD